MEVILVALVREYQKNRQTGNVDILGSYNEIHVPVPSKINGMALVVRFAVYPEDFGKPYSFCVQIMDDDAVGVISHTIEETTPTIPEKRTIFRDHFIVMPEFDLVKHGSYDIVIYMDGQYMATHPLEVTL